LVRPPRLVANEPFAVILPDDVIGHKRPAFSRWSEATKPVAVWSLRWRSQGQSVILWRDRHQEDFRSMVSVEGLVENPLPTKRRQPGDHWTVYSDPPRIMQNNKIRAGQVA
jgi:UTP-glucose-1-phosphate uridylyltransferase